MTIDRLGGINPLKNIPKIQQNSTKPVDVSGSDTINISDQAKQMAELYYLSEVAAATPDVRADKVSSLREQIQDPNYLSAERIASTADKIATAFGF